MLDLFDAAQWARMQPKYRGDSAKMAPLSPYGL